MNYIDYIIIGVVVFYGLWGLSKGLLKIILDFAGYIVAFFAAKLLSPMLMTQLSDTGFQTNIQNKIIESFEKLNPELSNLLPTIKIPENISGLVQQEPGLNKIFTNYPNLLESLESNLGKISGRGFIEVITEYVLLIICVVLIFLVVKVLFSVVVSIILSRQDQMPLALTNRVLGLTFGLAIAFILISFGLQLIEVFTLTSSPVLSETIATSKFASIFTSIPLVDWLSKIM